MTIAELPILPTRFYVPPDFSGLTSTEFGDHLDDRRKVMAAKQFPSHATHFVDFHAVADIAHAAVLRKTIEDIGAKSPEAAGEIDYAFSVFAAVYPLPIWDACARCSRAEIDGGGVI